MDPELEAFIPLLPPIDVADPVATRTNFAARAAARPAPDTSGLEIEDRMVPADRTWRSGLPTAQARGAIIWLHGGGFVFGDLETEHPWASKIADGLRATVISVRLPPSPEHRFPAALDDAYAVSDLDGRTRGRTRNRPGSNCGRRSQRRSGTRRRRGAAGARPAGPVDSLPAAQRGRARRPAADVVGPALHRYAVGESRHRRRIVASLLGLGARHALRRSGAGRRSVRPPPGLHRHR